ncbi:MAG: hypothetical protein HRT88_18265, partial [Lentisphaeraceae bacterium]|nr:hypothetical protein [Lentisphaeraceae bacterium]
MTRLCQILIATGLISQSILAVESAEDKRVQELRRQASLTRSIKRSTLQVKNNLQKVRDKMLISGVIDKNMIATVDLVLQKAQNAGDNALQDTIKNLLLALDNSGRKDQYLKRASTSQKIALKDFEVMLKEARKKADKARTEAKLEELIDKSEQLNEDTKEVEQAAAEGKEIDQDVLDELAEKQKEISDLAEQVHKELEELKKQEEEIAQEDDSQEEEEQQAEDESDKGELAEKSDEIAEQLEDGKIEEAVKEQQEMIDQLKEMAGDISGDENQDDQQT